MKCAPAMASLRLALCTGDRALQVPVEGGTIHVHADDSIPRGVFLHNGRRREKLMGGDRTGIILARFVPEKTRGTYAWLNIVSGHENTRRARNRHGKTVSFPYIDPLPGKTEFGRADTLPYYWDYADTNRKKKGIQGMKGGQSDLEFPGSKPDGIADFWDGPIDRKRAEISFATFLVLRPDTETGRALEVLGGFRWTFHEGPKRKGFDNGDESIQGLAPIGISADTCKLITRALQNSELEEWQAIAGPGHAGAAGPATRPRGEK